MIKNKSTGQFVKSCIECKWNTDCDMIEWFSSLDNSIQNEINDITLKVLKETFSESVFGKLLSKFEALINAVYTKNKEVKPIELAYEKLPTICQFYDNSNIGGNNADKKKNQA